MKFLSLLAAALLPTGILAAPAADGKLAAIEAETRAAVEARQSPNEPALAGLDKREVQVCEIVGGASKVNCRSGPNTSSSVVRTLTRGNTYAFSCVQSGECVVINGATNCGWDWSYTLGCYVNGHYTDNDCTLAKLGRC